MHSILWILNAAVNLAHLNTRLEEVFDTVDTIDTRAFRYNAIDTWRDLFIELGLLNGGSVFVKSIFTYAL